MGRTLFCLPILLMVSACGANLAGNGSGIVTAYGRSIHWHHLEQGEELAWILEKPMLVDFHVPEGCTRCERMNREVYHRPEIAREVNAEFVPVLIDLTRNLTREELDLGRKAEYAEDCRLVFLDYRGEIIEGAGGGSMSFAGFVDPASFTADLASAMASR